MEIVKAWKFSQKVRVKVWLNPEDGDDVLSDGSVITLDDGTTMTPNVGDILKKKRREIDIDVDRYDSEGKEKEEAAILTEVKAEIKKLETKRVPALEGLEL